MLCPKINKNSIFLNMFKASSNKKYSKQQVNFIQSTTFKNIGLATRILSGELKKNVIMYSITGTLCYSNGSLINFPDYSIQQLYYKYFKMIPTNVNTVFYIKNNCIVLSRKRLKYFGKHNNQQSVVSFQQINNLKKTYLIVYQKFLQQVILYFELTKLLVSRSNLSVLNIHSKLLKDSKRIKIKAKQGKLRYKQNLQTIILKRKQLQLSSICSKDMAISMINVVQKPDKTLLEILNNQLNQTMKTLMDQTAGNIHIINKITQKPNHSIQIIGGVSTVKRMPIQEIIYMKEGNEKKFLKSKFFLAKKQLKQGKCEDKFQKNNSKIRFEREIEIIKHILKHPNSHKFYLLDYFYFPQNSHIVYSDWEDLSLVNYLEIYKGKFRIQQMFNLSIQIVLIILDLHQCGIVHRDLKPSNFMVRFKPGRLHPILKLIDFGDSFYIDGSIQQFKQQNYKLYSTPLYCPLETSTFSEDYVSNGLNKSSIDNWSIGIIIFQIFYGFLPISYSSGMTKDIQALWRSQFMNQIDQKNQNQIGYIHSIIGAVSYQLIKMNQEERMSLQTVLLILLLSQRQLKQIRKNIFCKITNV